MIFLKKLIKPSTLFPVICGLIIGAVLFILGAVDDAPGLSLVGLVAAFLLIIWGIFNSGIIRKDFLAPILISCFGAGGLLLSLVLLFDGEFGESVGIAYACITLGVVLLFFGLIMLRKTLIKK